MSSILEDALAMLGDTTYVRDAEHEAPPGATVDLLQQALAMLEQEDQTIDEPAISPKPKRSRATGATPLSALRYPAAPTAHPMGPPPPRRPRNGRPVEDALLGRATLDPTLLTNRQRAAEVALSGAGLASALEQPAQPGLFSLAQYSASETSEPAAESSINALAAGYAPTANGHGAPTTTAGLEVSRSANNRSMSSYINLLCAVGSRTGTPAAPRVDATAPGSGFGQSFLREVLHQSPHRSQSAAEQVQIERLRKATTGVARKDIEVMICTPRPNRDMPCVSDADCAGYRLRNRNGELIGGSRLATFIFPLEFPRLQNGTDRAPFRRELTQRMCILCKIRDAQRVHHNFQQSNTAADAAAGCATDFHCFVDINGEYPHDATVGPGKDAFTMLLFPLPRYTEVGWRRVESVAEGCTYFVNDFTPPFPVPDSFYDEHRAAGF